MTMEFQGHGGIAHFGNSGGRGRVKSGNRPWCGVVWIFAGIAQYEFSPEECSECSIQRIFPKESNSMFSYSNHKETLNSL